MKTNPSEDAVRLLEGHLDAGASIHLGRNGEQVQLVYVGPLGELGAHGDSIPEAVEQLQVKVRGAGARSGNEPH